MKLAPYFLSAAFLACSLLSAPASSALPAGGEGGVAAGSAPQAPAAEAAAVNPATTGLTGLFHLQEEKKYLAHVFITTEAGVQTLALTEASTIGQALKSAKVSAKGLAHQKGAPVRLKQAVEHGDEIFLFGAKYRSDFQRVELEAPVEKAYSTSMEEGETVVLSEGKPGLALKTVVEVSKHAAKGVRPEVTEKLTIVLAPEPKKLLVGVGGGETLTAEPPAMAGEAPSKLSRPVPGPVTSAFGMRTHPITGVYKLHDGTDFSGACGTPVRAAARGVVTAASYEGGYGNKIDVDHGGGFVTSYTHLSSFSVEPGTVVDEATVIGLVGTTGYSTGCHLHFMTVLQGEPLDPMGFLE